MNESRPPPRTNAHEALPSVLEQNIAALIERRKREEREQPRSTRIADTITRFTGSMRFVILHVVLFGTWITVNLPITPLPKFDPSFVVLAMFASVEAIFLSTFVLITQNRVAEQATKRAELDLQISLFTEHELTRVLDLVAAIAEKHGITPGSGENIEPLKKDVEADKLLDRIEAQEKRKA